MSSVQAKMVSGLFKMIDVNRMLEWHCLICRQEKRDSYEKGCPVSFWQRVYPSAGSGRYRSLRADRSGVRSGSLGCIRKRT